MEVIAHRHRMMKVLTAQVLYEYSYEYNTVRYTEGRCATAQILLFMGAE